LDVSLTGIYNLQHPICICQWRTFL